MTVPAARSTPPPEPSARDVAMSGARVRTGRLAATLAAAASIPLAIAAARHASEPRADRPVARLAAAVAAAQESPPDRAVREAQDDRPRSREVVVRVDDRTDVLGVLELESDDVVVVKTPDGGIRSFARGDFRQVFHLLGADSGRRGRLVLRDGTEVSGLVLRDDLAGATLDVAGVRMTFERAAIDRLEVEPTVRERYEHRVALLDRDDVVEHYRLCRWLADENEWELADYELGRLLGRMDYAPARRLQRVVAARIELVRGRAEHDAEREDADEADDRSIPPPRRLLDEPEIDLVRVYEIDFARPPRVDVPRSVVGTLLDRYADADILPDDPAERDRLHRLPSIEIVRLMFALRARELYGEIRVRSEPPALDAFRRRVHDTYLIRRCGSCHHANHPGPFRLVVDRHRRAEVRYTNLLLLERTRVPGGRLVDYDDPASSLIVQYALPRARARTPHPDVDGFEAVFAAPGDPRMQATIEWIESMFRPRPEYPIALEPEDVFGPRATAPGPAAEGAEAPDPPPPDAAGSRRER